MSEPRDYAREIGQAMAAGDVAALGALCIELVQTTARLEEIATRDNARRARQANKKRLQRDSVPSASRDTEGHEGTSRDTLFPLVPPSPLPAPNPSSPFNPPSPKLAASGRTRVDYSPEFERFWEAYPREARCEKQKAFKAFRTRLREGHTADVIVAGLERYKAFLATNNRFAKNPSTFVGPDLPFLETWEVQAPRALPSETPQQRAERLEAERRLRTEKVLARRRKIDGEEWWAQINRDAGDHGITKPGDVYEYAYKQLAG